MSELKSFRKIDSRNILYGQYKYQVRPGRMRDTSFWTLESWCREKWGSDSTWVFKGGSGWKTYNQHWRIVYPGGRKTPIIYLKGDNEATLFSLVWAGR